MKKAISLEKLKRLILEDLESNDESFRPTVDWMSKKYAEINRRIFNWALGRCSFELFTSGRGASGKVLGTFSIKAENLRYSRRTGQLFIHEWGGDVTIDHDNFDIVCHPTIRLNGNYHGKESAFLNVLVHEMIHYATYMNGFMPKQAHGPEFRKLCRQVAVKSEGEFEIGRVASAEDSANLNLDAEVQAKNQRRADNRLKGAVAVMVFRKNGDLELTIANNPSLIRIIANTRSKDPEVDEVVTSHNHDLLSFLVSQGFNKIFRRWKIWRIPDTNPIQKEIVKLMNADEDAQRHVRPFDYVNEDDNEFGTIPSDMNLSLKSPLES